MAADRRASRRATLAAAVLACWSLAAPASAQQVEMPKVVSPLRVDTEVNGVNVLTGKMTLATPTLSIPAAPRLKFDWVQNWAPYVLGTITPVSGGEPDARYSIHTGGSSSLSFRCTTNSCSSVTLDGSSFETNLTTFNKLTLAGSGAIYTFDLKHVDTTGSSPRTAQYYASSISYPDGETITLTYDSVTTVVSGISRTFYRPTKAASNLGYFVAISYQSATFGTNAWGMVAEAGIYAAAAPTTPLARLTYSGNSITDLAGRVFTCSGCDNRLGADIETTSGSLTLPTESTPAIQATATANGQQVGSVVKDGVTWTYTYANPRLNGWGNGWLFDSVAVAGPNGYNMLYTMAVSGQRNVVASIRNGNLKTSGYVFDGNYRLTGVTQPELNGASVGYDNWGNINLKTVKAKPGSPTLPDIVESAYVNNATCTGVLCYRPEWTKDALNRQTSYSYNALGQLTQQLEPADQAGVQRKTIVEYDTGTVALSRRKVVRICGVTTTCGTTSEIRTEYDYAGSTALPSAERQVDQATGKTLTTSFTYDTAGRLLSADGPLAGTADATYSRYDVLGRRTWEIGAAGVNGVRPAKRFTYRDADDKVTNVEIGTVPNDTSTALTVVRQIDTLYDTRRNAKRETVSAGGTLLTQTGRTFDNRGQLVCEAVRMNPAVFASIGDDACALGTQGSFGPDRITRNSYDADGQLTRVERAVGTALAQDYVRYSYTDNGKRAFVTDANGNVAKLTWDRFDRQDGWYFPSKTSVGQTSTTDYEAYGYDAVGNRTSLRRRDGRTFTFAYDNLNRVVTKGVPDGCAPTQVGPCPAATATRDVYYGYDLRNAQTFARFDSASGAGTTNTYDAFGRPLTASSNMSGTARTLTYEHDDGGRRTKITHPDGNFFRAEYDARGAQLRIYDTANTLLTQKGYDDLGRQTSDFSGAESYGYDALDRVTSHGFAFGKSYDNSATFTFAPSGQIATRTRSNDGYAFPGYVAVDRSYAVNGLNQYTTAGAATFGYDANGNLTSDGTTSWGYDAENRVVSSSAGAALSYDPLGRLERVSNGATARRFVYDGDRLVEERDDAGNILRRYAHASGVDEPFAWYEGAGIDAGARRTLLADQQGSILVVRNASNDALAINAYDEYGITRNSGNSAVSPYGTFGYTGQAWLPELGMYYYKARIYSPTLGRFLQVDPVGYDDQINLYAYVANDPVNGRDPTGMCATGSRVSGNKAVGCKKGQDAEGDGSDAARRGVGHPGEFEYLIPIWGPGREAIADFEEGRYLQSAANTALAVSDVFLIKSVSTMLVRGGWKVGGHSWTATRAWLKARGHLPLGKVGHHWLIPQRRWGKDVPNWIKNQPWNIRAMEAGAHRRLHQKSVTVQIIAGSPTGARATAASGAGRIIDGDE